MGEGGIQFLKTKIAEHKVIKLEMNNHKLNKKF